MTATDELQKLLDEHAVKYNKDDGGIYHFNHCHVWAINDEMLCLSRAFLTPVQVIEAAFGRWECEWQLVKKGPCYLVFRCSACGYEHASSNTDACATELDPRYCPNCGRKVENDG